MSPVSRSWFGRARGDVRSRAVLLVTLAALVLGLALQSARACVLPWSPGKPIEQVAAPAGAPGVGDPYCHHDATAVLDACFVHCEQDGQAARVTTEPGADDLRVAVFDAPSAQLRWQAVRVVREPFGDTRRLDLPTYLLLGRLKL